MQNADLENIVSAAEADNPALKTNDFIGRAEKLKEELDNGLMRVDAITDPTLRSVALIQLREQLGLRANEFLRLVELLSKFTGEQPPEDFNELREWASRRRKPAVVEDLLGSDCLTVWARQQCRHRTTQRMRLGHAAKPKPFNCLSCN